jgi:hypothetical protein
MRMTWTNGILPISKNVLLGASLKVDVARYNKSGRSSKHHNNQNTFIDIAVQGTRSRGGMLWY